MSNMAFHDLTINQSEPTSSRITPGLGLKFVVTPTHPSSPTKIQPAIDIFERRVKLSVFYAGEDVEALKTKLRVASKWTPPAAMMPQQVINRLAAFRPSLLSLYNRRRKGTPNISKSQRRRLRQLKHDQNILTVNCDKNLGLAQVALDLIGNYLRENSNLLEDCDVDALIDALHLVMNNMIFQFGDLFYRQTTGTAMGVPPAVDWANIYVGLHELDFLNNSTIKPHLYFYKRFVDDVFGIWIPYDDPEIDEQLWASFVNIVNSFHDMEWTFSRRSTRVEFMDLGIELHNGSVVTRVYEKPLALYQYIPHSAHPPGCRAGLDRSGPSLLSAQHSQVRRPGPNERILQTIAITGTYERGTSPLVSEGTSQSSNFSRAAARRAAYQLQRTEPET
ncbi:hypothetical protein THAOC_24858 [Thalassiosira oceanica]|uniref:Reverse transcriptase domain-containing protein n=1 Tax=Thalassiosira oceanica TaxID=159749 RepID=K0RNR2_THAOC|nr:hypothetical protein THAOC_24858 [Thalassiosira oceanica]|eukprot:EJK55413.1 hypothetical protein THAOC_24858 [Thalassiosira oceanica]